MYLVKVRIILTDFIIYNFQKAKNGQESEEENESRSKDLQTYVYHQLFSTYILSGVIQKRFKIYIH